MARLGRARAGDGGLGRDRQGCRSLYVYKKVAMSGGSRKRRTCSMICGGIWARVRGSMIAVGEKATESIVPHNREMPNQNWLQEGTVMALVAAWIIWNHGASQQHGLPLFTVQSTFNSI
jgi:hypothetical protein